MIFVCVCVWASYRYVRTVALQVELLAVIYFILFSYKKLFHQVVLLFVVDKAVEFLHRSIIGLFFIAVHIVFLRRSIYASSEYKPASSNTSSVGGHS